MNLEELNTNSSAKSVKISPTGKLLIGVTGGFAIGLTVICAPFVSPALRKFCLPYIPATDQQIKNVLKALTSDRGKLLDLGSGDGRIVLETARQNGFISHGIELNPWLVLYSKVDALRKGLRERTRFYRGDLWKFDISSYDRIVIFGVQQMMSDLEVKLLHECKPDCRIVACRFPLPNLQPIRTLGEGIDTVWLYQIGKDSST